MSEQQTVYTRCVCGHWKGHHFRLPPETGQSGGCMRLTEKSPACPCRGFESDAEAGTALGGRDGH